MRSKGFLKFFVMFVLILTACNSGGGVPSWIPPIFSSNDVSSSDEERIHIFTEEWSHDANNHWHNAACGHDEKSNNEPHDFSSIVVDPTYEKEGSVTFTCKVCGYSYTRKTDEKLEHQYADEWSFDDTKHWQLRL